MCPSCGSEFYFDCWNEGFVCCSACGKKYIIIEKTDIKAEEKEKLNELPSLES